MYISLDIVFFMACSEYIYAGAFRVDLRTYFTKCNEMDRRAPSAHGLF
jgi:hypothetical protein